MLPDYRNSLHVRYPPVCDKCLPAVEEEIRSKDHMARTKALGGWLKQSKGKEKQRKVSGSGKQREKLGVQLAAWRIRGCLWALTLVIAVAGNSTGEQFSYSYRSRDLLTDQCGNSSCLRLFPASPDSTFKAYSSSTCAGFDIMGRMGSNLLCIS